MKVAIGTIEISDDVRRMIRRVRGRDGLATREEVHEIVRDSIRERFNKIREQDYVGLSIRLDGESLEDESVLFDNE